MNSGYQKNFLIFVNEDSGYEAGRKPSGYIRIEVRDGKGRLRASVQNLRQGGGRFDYYLYLIKSGSGGISPAYTGGAAGWGAGGGRQAYAGQIGAGLTSGYAGHAGGGLISVCAGRLQHGLNGSELEWTFEPGNVGKSGYRIGDFDIAAIIVEYADRNYDAVICPLAAYKNKKTEWRKSFGAAVQAVGAKAAGKAVQPAGIEPAGKGPAGTEASGGGTAGTKPTGGWPAGAGTVGAGPVVISPAGIEPAGTGAYNAQPGMYAEDEIIKDIYENAQKAENAGVAGSAAYTPNAENPGSITETDKKDINAANKSNAKKAAGTSNAENMENKVDTAENAVEKVPKADESAADMLNVENTGNTTNIQNEANKENAENAAGTSIMENTENAAGAENAADNIDTNCVYLNANICGAFINNSGNEGNPCSSCGMHNNAKPSKQAQTGDVSRLKEELSSIFEQSDPFNSRRSDYTWWKVTNPVNLNNILYQCNIRSPLLFNPAVMMAHYKYRHLIIGIFNHKENGKQYVVCGVPGMNMVDGKPFGDSGRWVQAEGNRPRYGAFGYWLVYIDPADGKILTI